MSKSSQSQIKQQLSQQNYEINQYQSNKVEQNEVNRWEMPIIHTDINLQDQVNKVSKQQSKADISSDLQNPKMFRTFSNFMSEKPISQSKQQLYSRNQKKSINQDKISKQKKQSRHSSRLQSAPRASLTAQLSRKNSSNKILNKTKQKGSEKKQKLLENNKITTISRENQIKNRSLTSNLKRVINIKIRNNNTNSKEKIRSISKNQFAVKNKEKSHSVSRSKTPNTHFSLNSKKPVPQQIQQYLKKRQDVEIIQFFQQYKKQFQIKSKTLQDYIFNSKQPQKIKNTYLNEADTHFRCGLETIMLKLFRNGTIVQKSYDNLREQAVTQIEKWVIGWIHRKILYGKFVQDQENQIVMVQDSLKHLDDYRRMIANQDTSF